MDDIHQKIIYDSTYIPDPRSALFCAKKNRNIELRITFLNAPPCYYICFYICLRKYRKDIYNIHVKTS